MSDVKLYKNDHGEVSKDDMIAKIVPDKVTECAVYLGVTDVCSSSKTVEKIAQVIEAKSTNDAEIISEAKEQLGCKTEKCVLVKLRNDLGQNVAKSEIDARFKISGPNDISLLSNYNIDETLKQWQIKFKDFYAYNFNMLNYAEYSLKDGYVMNSPDTLATVSFEELYKNGYRCAACVINSDKYQGRGKHWMALFIDARDGAKWSVEFFNSSGNAPAPEWINWQVKTCAQMNEVIKQNNLKAKASIVRVTSIRHQHSKTECGLYSLFYIYSRLNGIPYTYFSTTPVQDQLMFEFRQHLFDDPKNPEKLGVSGGKFVWDKYKKEVRVQWE